MSVGWSTVECCSISCTRPCVPRARLPSEPLILPEPACVWPTSIRSFLMLTRVLGLCAVLLMVVASLGSAQAKPARSKEPVADGRTLSQWVADLKAESPQTRNAAAYEIAGMGPAAAAAVPDLIKALDDPVAAVRFPATVALMEIGPAAKA